MRSSLCLRFCLRSAQRAESISALPLSAVDSAAAQLLPPILLYRRLLRAHRTLDREMRTIGDDYVKVGLAFFLVRLSRPLAGRI
jgi:hypothetical protein